MIDVKMICVFVIYLAQYQLLMSQTTVAADLRPYTAGHATPSLATALTCSSHPAVIPDADGFALAILAENRFSVRGLSFAQISALHIFARAAAGASLQTFGTAAFRQSSAIIHYGIAFGKVGIGAAFTYAQTSLAGRAGNSQAKITFAFQGDLTPVVTALVHVGGIAAFRSDSEREAVIYSAGLLYKSSENLWLGFELQKTEDRSAETAATLCYQIDKRFRLRGGCFLPAGGYLLGISWLLDSWRIECSIRTHPVLPVSPAFFTTYQKNRG